VRSSRAGGRRAVLGLWLALLAAYATSLGLAGDGTSGARYSAPEAHRLLSASSIAEDGSLDLTDEYRERSWGAWYPGELRPTAREVGGRIAEPHGLGLPLLLAPAYALGGPLLAELLCAACMALAVVLSVRLARRVVPDPWATAGTLVVGLSPPVLAAATTVGPAGPGAALLAGGLLLALMVRDQPRVRWTLGCALCVAVLPWLGVSLLAPAAVVAAVLARWLRRRQRGLAGFVALEVVLTSAVVFITVNDRVFGGPLPSAARAAGGPATGADGVMDFVERLPRLAGVLVDRDVGVLRWAPVAALALVALGLLARSRRARLGRIAPGQVETEAAALALATVGGAAVLTAGLVLPELHGPWLVHHSVAAALPLAGGLVGWSLRHLPRAGGALAAITLAGSAWLVVGSRLSGSLPWGGLEAVLPRLG
jgi:hypothetical protein